VSATAELIATLREHRALEVPQIELVQSLDGARTLQTVLRQAKMGGPDAARAVWVLACVGAVVLGPEPLDLRTPERRAVAMARRHLRALAARIPRTTYYDLLEITPAAGVADVDHACRMLMVRYDPERLQAMDTGDAAPLIGYAWHAIRAARATLSDPPNRLRYNEEVARRRGTIDSVWAFGPHDRARAEEAFARGQRALLAGEPFKAVSEMAAAARAHADHPDYEASLAWARYRAEMSREKPRADAARTERKVAEEAVVGRRPWPRALVALALLCAADEDADSARWHLGEALACDPNHPTAKQLLARLAHAQPPRR
jgi:hypothetical protein